MISNISSLEIANVVIPYQKCFFWITSSVAATAAAVNCNGIKTLSANGLSTFFIKGKPVFSNGPKSLLKKAPDCLVLDIWVFDNFILTYEIFTIALRSLGTCVLINNID